MIGQARRTSPAGTAKRHCVYPCFRADCLLEVPNAPIADVLRASTVQVGSGFQVEKKKTKEEEDIDALLADLDALDTKKVRAPRPSVVWFVDVCDGFCGRTASGEVCKGTGEEGESEEQEEMRNEVRKTFGGRCPCVCVCARAGACT